MSGQPHIALDPRMPRLDECLPRHVLHRHAEERPHQVFVQFEDGETWTYSAFKSRVLAVAARLQRLGVRQGQHVVTWLPNGPEALTLWFAINYIGAVYVPLNVAYRSRILQLALQIADGVLLVAHAKLIDRLASMQEFLPPSLVVVGEAESIDRSRWTPGTELFHTVGQPAPLEREIMPWDLQSIVYTSGTTGPSKGVLQSYFHQFTIAGGGDFLSQNDHYLMTLPLYHQGGITGVNRMFFLGGSIAMIDSFSTSTFWPVVRSTQVTAVTLLGTMAKFLAKQPPSAEDRNHTLRTVIMCPLQDQQLFAERFGVDVYTVYNMTELGAPLVSGRNPTATGTCGQARPGFDLRVVDENDCEVPVGQVGELVVRTDVPWAQTSGYYKDSAATARAWRNGWFHTGDGFRRDEQGNYYFRDRLKDAIRRRGENVSAFEVESEICALPSVREAAAVGVPSENSEDEILAVVAPVAGMSVDPSALLEFLRPRLAHFMIPRYVRVMAELPRTASHKVQKQSLRDDGVTLDTWDREKAGISFHRDRL